MQLIFLLLTIIAILATIIFGFLQVVIPFIKKEVRFSKRFPFVETAEVPAKRPRRRRKKKRKRVLIPILAIGILIIIVVLVRFLVFQAKVRERVPIAVISFTNHTGDAQFDYLCEAIPNLLITNLEQSEYLSVLTWERMRDLLKVLGREDVRTVDEDLGFELCEMDNIHTVVTGSFTKAGNMFVTEFKVLNVANKKILKTSSSQGEGVASILKIQIDELTEDIAKSVSRYERAAAPTEMRIMEVTTNSMEAYNYFLRGREDCEKMYYDDARQFLEKAIELDSTFASAYLYLADVYLSLHDNKARDQVLEKAKVLSEKATEKERLYIEATYAYDVEDNPEKRFRILKELTSKYPKEKRAHQYLGWYYKFKGLFYRALEEFNTALELDPNYGEASNGLAYTYADMGDYTQAIEYFKRYAAVSPGDANPFDSMGDLYFRMGQLDNALAKYKEAIEVKQDFMWSSLNIAYIYALREDYADAMKWIDHYITMASSSGIKATGYWYKAFYYRFLGEFDQALNTLDTAEYLMEPIEYESGSSSVDGLRALVYRDMKEYELSQNYSKDWYAYAPDSPFYTTMTVDYNFDLGLTELEQENTNSARARLATIKSYLPDVEPRYKDLALFLHDLLYAEVLLAQDSLEKCIAVFEKTAKLEVDAPVYYFPGIYNIYNKDIVARAYKKKGDVDRAIFDYEQLITPDPNKRGRLLIHPLWRYSLAKLYEEKGEKAKAIAEYEKFLDIWKDADDDLPEPHDARKRLANLKTTN